MPKNDDGMLCTGAWKPITTLAWMGRTGGTSGAAGRKLVADRNLGTDWKLGAGRTRIPRERCPDAA
jgi:hypothetical protein